jgi:hypothetical protein
MRLSDAGLRWRPTKLIYADHRPTPWLTEAAAPRSLEPIVRRTIEVFDLLPRRHKRPPSPGENRQSYQRKDAEERECCVGSNSTPIRPTEADKNEVAYQEERQRCNTKAAHPRRGAMFL